MLKIIFLGISTTLVLYSFNYAKANSCAELNSPQAVLDCALEKHPDAVRGKGLNDQGDTIESVARQLPNPELNSKAVYGDNFGTRVGSTEISLMQNFELGGKRSARIERAIAEKTQISSQFQKSKEEVYVSTARTLYRVRQLYSEIKILDEALYTFSKIHRQYQSRPRLNPEQQVTTSIFQLAEGDYRLRKALIESEVNDLERHLEMAIGETLKITEKILPPKKQTWPKLSDESSDLSFSSDWKLSETSLKLAQAEALAAKGTSWPDLKIGPTVQIETEGTTSFQTYGLSLTMTLPLFHLNGAGRTFASQSISIAEKSHEAKKIELKKEKQVLFDRYKRSLKALNESVSHSELEKKHKNIESLFQRGIIASSLVIEAHRQLVDFTRSQNEQELDALETFWKVKALEGRLLETPL